MTWELFKSAFPVLAVLAYILVSTTLNVLATQRRFAIDMHNRVREAKVMRRSYLRTLEERRQTQTG